MYLYRTIQYSINSSNKHMLLQQETSSFCMLPQNNQHVPNGHLLLHAATEPIPACANGYLFLHAPTEQPACPQRVSPSACSTELSLIIGLGGGK